MRRIERITTDQSYVDAGVECRSVARKPTHQSPLGQSFPHPSTIRLIRQIRLIRRPFDLDASYGALHFRGELREPTIRRYKFGLSTLSVTGSHALRTWHFAGPAMRSTVIRTAK